MNTCERLRPLSAGILAAWLIFWAPSQLVVADSAEKPSPKNEQLYRVVVDGKCGYINRQGRMVIQPQFFSYGEFHDGLAQASDGNGFSSSTRRGRKSSHPPSSTILSLSQAASRRARSD